MVNPSHPYRLNLAWLYSLNQINQAHQAGLFVGISALGLDYLVSTDGFCGPKHNNASCLGTDKQCCNAGTWKCSDSEYVIIIILRRLSWFISSEDCASDVCYKGFCSAPLDVYSLDGKCGPSTGGKICLGKWEIAATTAACVDQNRLSASKQAVNLEHARLLCRTQLIRG
jgi:hypothetical protein